MQAQADLAQIPVDVYPSAHATPLGAAACARLALDPAAQVVDAVGGWTPQRTYEPAWSADRAAEHMARWHAPRRRALGREAQPRDLRPDPHRTTSPSSAPASWAPPSPGPRRHGLSVAARRGAGRRRRRHQQGQHRHPAHRLRRHAGHAGVPPRRPRLPAARRYAARTGIPVERTGALLVAWTDEELRTLPALLGKAQRNGYRACAIVGADEVYRQLPDLGAGALGGLTVPGESDHLHVDDDPRPRHRCRPARRRPAAPARRHGPRRRRLRHHPAHRAGEVRARWIVNAAGLGADVIDRLFGYDRFTVTPRRGELLVFDKLARPLVPRIVLPVPSSVGKGVLISPTIYGNVMLGPTAEDLPDRTATGTTEAGLEFLLDKGRRLMPRLLQEEVTAAYAGLRAAIDRADYLVELDGGGGICSSRASARPA